MSKGNTDALVNALLIGNKDLCLKLLREGCQPDASAFSLAIMFGYSDICLAILDYDLNLKDAAVSSAKTQNIHTVFSKIWESSAINMAKLKSFIESGKPLTDLSFVLAVTDSKELQKLANNIDFLNSHPLILNNLFDELNPKREIDLSLTLLDVYHLVKRFANTLGLNNNITTTKDDQEWEIDIAGWTDEPAIDVLNSQLLNYINTLNPKHQAPFVEIQQAIAYSHDLMINNSTQYQEQAYSELSKRYHQGNLTFLSSGWQGHSLSIALYGNYLAITNRGEGQLDTNQGTQVYKLKDPKQITPEMLKKLSSTYNETSDSFYDTLSKVVEVDDPVLNLPTKSQEHKNCTYANSKSAVEAMLVLCSNVQPQNSLQKLISAQMQTPLTQPVDRNTYKDFSRFARDHEISLILKYADMAKKPLVQDCYVLFIRSLILEHHGQNARSGEKAQAEMDRVIKLLKKLPKVMQKSLLQDESLISQLIKTFAMQSDHRFIDELLKLNPVLSGKHAQNALMSCARYGHAQACLTLINNGVKVSGKVKAVFGSTPATPLNWAAKNGHTDVCLILIIHGAEIDKKTMQLLKNMHHSDIDNALQEQDKRAKSLSFSDHAKGNIDKENQEKLVDSDAAAKLSRKSKF
ncbi:MAG: ankyrin repeat domain-containing protein [Candidatus Berkiella sp.]